MELENGVLSGPESEELDQDGSTTIHFFTTDDSPRGLVEAHAAALDRRLHPSVRVNLHTRTNTLEFASFFEDHEVV